MRKKGTHKTIVNTVPIFFPTQAMVMDDEQAISAQRQEDVLKYFRKFLETREKRRTECKMSTSEIQDEMNFE